MPKLSTISMNVKPYKQNFDYLYNHNFEGISASNIKRSLYRDRIDHLYNENPLINAKMNKYYAATIKMPRDTRLHQASKELERQKVKLMKLSKQREFVQTFNYEMSKKDDYLNELSMEMESVDSLLTYKRKSVPDLKIITKQKALQRKMREAAIRI